MNKTLRLNGVHHTARPTWKLRETFHFYHDVLGLPLVHCVAARGWGPADHPDFLHFFFDSGAGSLIAFFYYLGHDQPERLVHQPKFNQDATHTAWRVETRAELNEWRERFSAKEWKSCIKSSTKSSNRSTSATPMGITWKSDGRCVT